MTQYLKTVSTLIQYSGKYLFDNCNWLKLSRTTQFFGIVISISTILFNVNYALAETSTYNGPRYTKSIGYVKNRPPEKKVEFSKQINSDQLKNTHAASLNTAPLTLNKKTSVLPTKSILNSTDLNSKQYLSPLSHTFTIHHATISLLLDDDQDGFFYYFSIKFDADTTTNVADVYARLYLSSNGGPWYHYYTTDTFTIYFDSANDEYEVITALSIGYVPDYYDIHIELFDTFDDSLVAHYGPTNSIDLTSVPLEDETHDYVEYYSDPYVNGGCTLQSKNKFDPVIPFLLIFSIFYLAKKRALRRCINKRQKNINTP